MRKSRLLTIHLLTHDIKEVRKIVNEELRDEWIKFYKTIILK